jgi:hypothetical protein
MGSSIRQNTETRFEKPKNSLTHGWSAAFCFSWHDGQVFYSGEKPAFFAWSIRRLEAKEVLLGKDRADLLVEFVPIQKIDAHPGIDPPCWITWRLLSSVGVAGTRLVPSPPDRQLRILREKCDPQRLIL